LPAYEQQAKISSPTPRPTPGNTVLKTVPSVSDAVMAADATLSIGTDIANRSQNTYVGIPGAFPKLPHQSPHLNGNMPAGGNLLMLDNHVEWRKFNAMTIRTIQGRPFWW